MLRFYHRLQITTFASQTQIKLERDCENSKLICVESKLTTELSIVLIIFIAFN